MLCYLKGDCSDPGPVTNGHKHPASGLYDHGDQIVFTCDAGYEMEGDSTIKCVYGYFNKPIPKCVQEMSGKL